MSEKRSKEAIVNDIINYFDEHEDVFRTCVEDLDGWNGWLGDDRNSSMAELDELMCGLEPTEILYRAFYGYDEDSYHTDSHGNREYGQFNPNRDWFHYNGYGNLVSTDYPDYSSYLYDGTIEAMAKCRGHLYSIEDDEELVKLFDELEEATE